MSVTLKTNQVKLKIQNGNYQAPVVIADQTTSEHVAEVNTAITTTGNQQVSAIQTKGNEVLNSIPEDYTDLVEDVGDLKSATNAIESGLIDIDDYLTNYNQGAIDIAGNKRPVSGYGYTNKISVSNIGSFLINGNATVVTNAFAWCIFYKADLSVKSYKNESAGPSFVDYVVDVPEDAEWVEFCFTESSFNTIKITPYYRKIISDLNYLKTEVTKLSQENLLKAENVLPNTAIRLDGIEANIQGFFSSEIIPIDSTCTLVFNGTFVRPQSSSFASIVWLNNDKKVVDFDNNTSQITYDSESIDIPENAMYFRFSFANESLTEKNTIVLYAPKYHEYRIELLAKEIAKNNNLLQNKFEMIGYGLFSKFAVIGDSLSVGFYTDSNGTGHNKDIYHSWGKYLSRISGNECYLLGYSGATTKSWLQNTSQEVGLNAAIALGEVPLYHVCMGANEVNMEIGTVEDCGTETDTLYRYVYELITELRTISPKCYIVCSGVSRTPIISAVNTVYETVCSMFNKCYYIDAAPYLNKTDFTELLVNGHYTALGYAKLGQLFNNMLSNVISTNYQDFIYLNETDIVS